MTDKKPTNVISAEFWIHCPNCDSTNVIPAEFTEDEKLYGCYLCKDCKHWW